jgi:hypothetical protein
MFMCFVNWTSVINLDLCWKQVFTYTIKIIYDFTVQKIPSFTFSVLPSGILLFYYLNMRCSTVLKVSLHVRFWTAISNLIDTRNSKSGFRAFFEDLGNLAICTENIKCKVTLTAGILLCCSYPLVMVLKFRVLKWSVERHQRQKG